MEAGIRLLLEGLGRDELPEEVWQHTPRRVARMFAELCHGLGAAPEDELGTPFAEPYDEMIVMRNMPFHSLCEHHLLPFVGRGSIAYVPRGERVAGASKLARLLATAAARPQLQERLTSQVADAIQEKLRPHGVLVHIEAEHLCMTIRGVRAPGSRLVTSALRGFFRTDAAAREEALSLIHQTSSAR